MIGTTLWQHNKNSLFNRKTEQPEEAFYAYKVIGATRDSWIVSAPERAQESYRVAKDTMRARGKDTGGYGQPYFYTDQGKDDYCWMVRHRRDIIAAVEACHNAAKLKAIAEVLILQEIS